MNYNDFSYYRANPYARQGYMPPLAFMNRHTPQFMTQIPMGEQHLQKIGKRQYAHGMQKSNIDTENILKSPQRYPYENRIALDKTYQRNMNTIDIEGATSGTLVSQAVRNKLKARQALIRKQKEEGSNQMEQLQHLQSTEEERRRQIAYQQYLRTQQMQQLNAGKLPKADSTDRIEKLSNDDRYRKYRQQQRRQMIQPRYRSIEVQRPSYNPQNQQILSSANKMRGSNGFNNSNSMSTSQVLNNADSYYNPQQMDNFTHGLDQKEAYSKNTPLQIDKKQLRHQNPTNLSSQSSIYRAGRNVVGQ